MKMICKLFSFLSLTTLAVAQPAIRSNGIVSAATYKGPIAEGSMFVVFGSGLGPATLVSAATSPLPKTLSQTEINVSAAGQTYRAPLIYVSAGQCAAILPSQVPVGRAEVTVSYEGQSSAPVSFEVARSNFGAFTNNARGDGPAVLQDYESPTTQPRNGLTESAKPGQVVTLWGTGLGPINDDDGGAPPVGDLPNDLRVTVSGHQARILYKGRSGCCAGIDQIIFEVPQNVDGCYAPLVVDTGSGTAQNTTISVASGAKTCTEPGLITQGDLAKAQSTGSLRIGSLLIANYDTGQNVAFGYGFLTFSKATYADLTRTNEQLAASAPGTCAAGSWDATSSNTTGNYNQLGYDFFYNYLFWTGSAPLDAGARVVFSGNGSTINFDRESPGYYFNFLLDQSGTNPYFQSTLRPGTYIVDSGSGGPDVPGFQTRITVPPPVKFTIADQVTVPRNNDYVVTWSGGSENDRVLISGAAYSLQNYSGGSFTCVAKASDGKFAVPASILSYLPQSTNPELGQSLGWLMLYDFSPYERSDVNGLDAFYGATLNMSYRLAQFQ